MKPRVGGSFVSDVLRTQLCTNPKAGAGAATDWSQRNTPPTFEAVTFANEGIDDLTLPDGTVIGTGFHVVTDEAGEGGQTTFPITVDEGYTMSIYVWVVDLDQAEAIRVARDNLTGGDFFGSNDATAIGEWVLIAWINSTADFTGTAPGYVVAKLTGGGATATEFFWTAVLIEQASSVGDYGDGDSPGWKWTGTAHESTSEMHGAYRRESGLWVARPVANRAAGVFS